MKKGLTEGDRVASDLDPKDLWQIAATVNPVVKLTVVRWWRCCSGCWWCRVNGIKPQANSSDAVRPVISVIAYQPRAFYNNDLAVADAASLPPMSCVSLESRMRFSLELGKMAKDIIRYRMSSDW